MFPVCAVEGTILLVAPELALENELDAPVITGEKEFEKPAEEKPEEDTGGTTEFSMAPTGATEFITGVLVMPVVGTLTFMLEIAGACTTAAAPDTVLVTTEVTPRVTVGTAGSAPLTILFTVPRSPPTVELFCPDCLCALAETTGIKQQSSKAEQQTNRVFTFIVLSSAIRITIDSVTDSIIPLVGCNE